MRFLLRAGVLLGTLFLLGGCGGGGGEVNLTGTLLRWEDQVATMEVLDQDLACPYDTISFSTEDLDDEGIWGPVVGDTITVTHLGWVKDPAQANVVSWGVAWEEMDGLLLAVSDDTVVMEPQDAAIREAYGTIQFSMEYIDEKGFQPGDAVEVLYIRGIQPGPPAQITAVDWGVQS